MTADPDLGAFHTPPVCDPSKSSSAAQRDCVSPGCSSTHCDYYVTLKQARGTSVAYTLQVVTKLFSSIGPTQTVTWNLVRCGTSQYSEFSGNDTVTCVDCPEGGDCSGTGLLAAQEAAAGNSTNSSLAGMTTVDLQNALVVTQANIVALPGYWASTGSSGLKYYSCPIPSACLPPDPLSAASALTTDGSGTTTATGSGTGGGSGGSTVRVRCNVGYAGIACR